MPIYLNHIDETPRVEFRGKAKALSRTHARRITPSVDSATLRVSRSPDGDDLATVRGVERHGTSGEIANRSCPGSRLTRIARGAAQVWQNVGEGKSAAMPELRSPLVTDRDLPQHQAALTLIRDRLDDPAVTSFDWLDLGCGSGKILQSAQRVLPDHFRAKIAYVGVELLHASGLEAERLAKSLFRRAEVITSELVASDALLAGTTRFDAVTMTNTVHEISPGRLSSLLIGTMLRLSEQGFFFIYDMESLPELELGAVPWRPAEIERVIRRLAECCGCSGPLPSVATWQHRSCNGWQIQVKRASMSLTREQMIAERRDIEAQLALAITDVLQLKLNETHAALDALSRYGSATDDERREAQRLAYDFWAIARSLQIPARLGELYDVTIAV